MQLAAAKYRQNRVTGYRLQNKSKAARLRDKMEVAGHLATVKRAVGFVVDVGGLSRHTGMGRQRSNATRPFSC